MSAYRVQIAVFFCTLVLVTTVVINSKSRKTDRICDNRNGEGEVLLLKKTKKNLTGFTDCDLI